jgi:hypothetical protein
MSDNDNVKQRMLQAKEAIKAKEYDKARKLLKGIDHPKAREWLARLEKQSPKRKWGCTEYILIGIAGFFICAFLSMLVSPQTTDDNNIRPVTTALPPTETSTPSPPTDPLARYIFASVSGIERIESVNSLSISGRDETQYDFTVRLLDSTDMNATLEAISAAADAYRAENSIASMTTFNVLVVQRNQTENWRYSGSQWFRRAIDGTLVTATPYPTQDPNAVVAPPVYVPAQNQSNVSSSGQYTCNLDKTCTQMNSCEEVNFQFITCGNDDLDADNDGYACDADCGDPD